MRRSTIQSPELRNTCQHHEIGLSCGIDGQPCIGHKMEVRGRGGKKTKVAEYRHREVVWDGLTESWIEGPWILCPKIRGEDDAEPVMPDM